MHPVKKYGFAQPYRLDEATRAMLLALKHAESLFAKQAYDIAA